MEQPEEALEQVRSEHPNSRVFALFLVWNFLRRAVDMDRLKGEMSTLIGLFIYCGVI